MNELDGRIEKEIEHYKSLKKKTQIFGMVLIALGVGFGLALAQSPGLAPIAGTLTAALYIGMGINLLARNININHEEEKAIRDIQVDDKLNKILLKLEDRVIETKN